MEFVIPPVANDHYKGQQPPTPRQLVEETIDFIGEETPFVLDSVAHSLEAVSGFGVDSLELGDPWAFVHSGITRVLLSRKEPLPLSTDREKMWEEEAGYMRDFRAIYNFVSGQRERIKDEFQFPDDFFRSLLEDNCYLFNNKNEPVDASIVYTDVFRIRGYLPGEARGRDSKTALFTPVETKHVEKVELRLQNPLLAGE